MKVSLKPSDRADKEWMVTIKQPNKRVTLYFSQRGASSYVHHRSIKKRREWLAQHKNKDFTISGVEDPRWWSRWLLWNKFSISAAKKDINERFGIDFI